MTEIIRQNERFLDKGRRLYEFNDEFLVVCPKCAEIAKVVTLSLSEKPNVQLFAPRQFVCLNCVFRDTWNGNQVSIGGGFDWYFRLPLWLKISCCNQTLWAYNFRHLDLIEQYVAAKLRERTQKGRNSFLSKLPNWLKLAKNRDEILKAIGKLKDLNYGKY
jgi:hypothetical protein